MNAAPNSGEPAADSGDSLYYVRVRGRIDGPFDAAALQSMARRGRFARHHEVSHDRQTWYRASDFPELFPARTERRRHSRSAPGPARMPEATVATAPGASETETLQLSESPQIQSSAGSDVEQPSWYYIAPDGERGPVTESELRALVVNGELSPDAFVWCPAMPDWAPVHEFGWAAGDPRRIPPPLASGARGSGARMPSRRMRGLLWITIAAFAGLLLITAAVAVLLLLRKADGISGPEDDRVSHALGLVASGYVLDRQGERFEVPVGSTGTCFSISGDGFLLTNKHVVELVWRLEQNPDPLEEFSREHDVKLIQQVWVFLNQKKHSAKIVHVSDDYDLAILKIERTGGPFFALSRSDEAHRSMPVYALGFPGAASEDLTPAETLERMGRYLSKPRAERFFNEREFEYSLTNGVVSRVTTITGERWIQHNADINPGNSGGPLVSRDGTVYGLNTWKHEDAAGLFYALGIAQLRQEIQDKVPSSVWR